MKVDIHGSPTVNNRKDTLQVIELNIINNCNRKCSFCPHSLDSYEHNNGYMTLDTVNIISNRLVEYGYTNTIAICGFGEPTLHKKLNEIITTLRRTSGILELITNGDLLTYSNIPVLFENGLDLLNVSVYDKETDIKVSNLLPSILTESQYVVKRRYTDEVILVNRNNIFEERNTGTISSCYLPSYKMLVDITGDVLLCCNDWTRKLKFGNLNEDSLDIIWFDRMNDIRMSLINGNRSIGPCKQCDINGTLFGINSVNKFIN